MRRELAANLRETASEPGGVRDGVRRLGSLRELAREAAVDTGRFRWERGLVFAVVAFAVLMLGQLALSLAFVEGLLAGGGGEGRFLGTEVSASDDGSSAFSRHARRLGPARGPAGLRPGVQALAAGAAAAAGMTGSARLRSTAPGPCTRA
jgi:hypothetical protein